MSAPRFVACILFIGVIVLRADINYAQNYPNKPIRIFTSEIGGGPDFTVRLIAPELTTRLGQQLVIDSRVAQIAIESVVKTPPDGYTLLFLGSPVWVLPLMRSVSFSALRDFLPVSLTVNSPSVVVVHPSLPVKSVRELITLAKARPGELSFASGTLASSTYIAGELFKSMANINIVGVPYKSSGPALIDLLGGHVQLAFVNAGPTASHVKAGRLRALAVTSAQPSPLAPGLPTVAASVPGYESGSKIGLFAPMGTPAAIISRLNHDFVQVVSLPDVKEKFLKSGVDTVGSSPEEFVATIKSEVSRLEKVIKDAGIKAD